MLSETRLWTGGDAGFGQKVIWPKLRFPAIVVKLRHLEPILKTVALL